MTPTKPTEERGRPCPSCGAQASILKTIPATYRYTHLKGCEMGLMVRRWPIGALVSDMNPYGPSSRYICSRNPMHQRHDLGDGSTSCAICWAEFEILAAAKGTT